MPPAAPTAASWRWSPVSSSFAPAAVTWLVDVRRGRWCWPSRTRRPRPGRRGPSRQSRSSPNGLPSARRCWVASQRAMLRAVQAFPGEHVGGDLARRQARRPGAAARPTSAGSCQAWASTPTTKDLPGAGRPDQRLDAGAGGEHAAHGGGLVGAELDPGLAQLLDAPAARRRGRARARARSAGGLRRAAARCGCAPASRTAARPALRRRSGRPPGAARRAGRARPAVRRPAAPPVRAPRR